MAILHQRRKNKNAPFASEHQWTGHDPGSSVCADILHLNYAESSASGDAGLAGCGTSLLLSDLLHPCHCASRRGRIAMTTSPCAWVLQPAARCSGESRRGVSERPSMASLHSQRGVDCQQGGAGALRRSALQTPRSTQRERSRPRLRWQVGVVGTRGASPSASGP